MRAHAVRWHNGAVGGDARAMRRAAKPRRSSNDPAAAWTLGRWRQVLRLRYLGIAILAATSTLVFGWPVGAVIALVGGLSNAAHDLRLHHRGRPPLWLPLTDVAFAAGIVALEPAALLPATLVMITSVAYAAAAGAPVPAAISVSLGTVALALLELRGTIDESQFASIGYAVSGLLVILGIGSLATSEARARARLTGLVDDLDAVLWTRHPTTDRFTYVNGRAAGLLGRSAEEWTVDGFWLSVVHPGDRARVEAMTRQAIAEQRDHDVTYRMMASDGHPIHVLDRVKVVTDGTGVVSELHGVTLDVTERHRIEQQSRQYADLVDHIDLALFVVRLVSSHDREWLAVVATNPAVEQHLEDPATNARGRPLDTVLPALGSAGLTGRLVEVARTGEPLRVDDIALGDASAPRTATVQAFRLPGGLVTVSLQDTTDVSRATRALRRQALHDALTGLPNRAQLDELIRAAVPLAADSGRPVALLIMDLDQFKEVNDALGHSVGDRLLIAVSDRLRAVLNPVFVARLGGDEFAIVLHGSHVDESAAVATAELAAVSLSAPFTIDDLRLQTNVSIGIALVPDHATDADELVRRADVAMYVAKRAGGSYAVYHPDEDRSSVARLTLIGDLRDAAPEGQLVLHYQPLLDLRLGVVTRAEALVRWLHPEHGLLPPDSFMGLAALSGATGPIARWVLREAAGATARWRAEGHDVGVAVNLSVRNLFDRDLIGGIEEIISEFALPPGTLTVELTESEIMDDPSVALAQFRALQGLGVGTSIDDFGTGYSSLTYLRDLPLSEIKVDRTFVEAMRRRSDDFTIVRSMIDLGHNLGLEVVAEGVESAEDLPVLTHLGCDRAQGFHIARPMPEADLLRWLEQTTATRTIVLSGQS